MLTGVCNADILLDGLSSLRVIMEHYIDVNTSIDTLLNTVDEGMPHKQLLVVLVGYEVMGEIVTKVCKL